MAYGGSVQQDPRLRGRAPRKRQTYTRTPGYQVKESHQNFAAEQCRRLAALQALLSLQNLQLLFLPEALRRTCHVRFLARLARQVRIRFGSPLECGALADDFCCPALEASTCYKL